MKIIYFVLFLCFGYCANAQRTKQQEEGRAMVEREIRAFKDSLRGSGMQKYYSIDLFNTSPDSNSLCFEISYVYDKYNYFFSIVPLRILKIGGDSILVRAEKSYSTKWLNSDDIKIADSLTAKRIRDRLASSHAFITHDGKAPRILCWYDGQTIRRKYCHWWGELSKGWPANHCCYAVYDFNTAKGSFACDSMNLMKPVAVPVFDKIK